MASKSVEGVRSSARELHKEARQNFAELKESVARAGFYRTPLLNEDNAVKSKVASSIAILNFLDCSLRRNYLITQESPSEDEAIAAAVKMKGAFKSIKGTNAEKIIAQKAPQGQIDSALTAWDLGIKTEILTAADLFIADFLMPNETIMASRGKSGGFVFHLEGRENPHLGELRSIKTTASLEKMLKFRIEQSHMPVLSTTYSKNSGKFTISQVDFAISIPDVFARKTSRDPVMHMVRMLDEGKVEVGDALWAIQAALPGEGLLAQPAGYIFSLKLVQSQTVRAQVGLFGDEGRNSVTRLVTEAFMKFAGKGIPTAKMALVMPDAVVNLDIDGQKITLDMSAFKK